MNRAMRLLALLTTLALMPATVVRFFGMNLEDTPWPGETDSGLSLAHSLM